MRIPEVGALGPLRMDFHLPNPVAGFVPDGRGWSGRRPGHGRGRRQEELGWPLDRKLFIAHLDELRKMRNKVMHFNPDPVKPSEVTKGTAGPWATGRWPWKS
jgi:hypothetical protein